VWNNPNFTGVGVYVGTEGDDGISDPERETMDELDALTDSINNFDPDLSADTGNDGNNLTGSFIGRMAQKTGDPLFVLKMRYSAFVNGDDIPTADELEIMADQMGNDFDQGYSDWDNVDYDGTYDHFVSTMIAIAAIPDPVIRDNYIKDVARAIRVPPSQLTAANSVIQRTAPTSHYVRQPSMMRFYVRMLPVLSYFIAFGHLFKGSLQGLRVTDTPQTGKTVHINLDKLGFFDDLDYFSDGTLRTDFEHPNVRVNGDGWVASPPLTSRPNLFDRIVAFTPKDPKPEELPDFDEIWTKPQRKKKKKKKTKPKVKPYDPS